MNRPMGTEAAAGKNPVSHVGKIYSILAHRIAEHVFRASEGIKEVYVLLLSAIGTPVDSAKMAVAQILPERGRSIEEMKASTEEIFHRELQNLPGFCMELAQGKYPVC
jgi:S-adenosylmethionine synthetase